MRSAVLAAALALACGSSRVSITGEPKYGKTAEEDYLAGVAEAKSGNSNEATKFLEHVRTKYPYSKYAALAELKLADIKADQDRNVEAAEAYATFVRMHPRHEEADRAAFREAEALAKDGPSDYFILPPAEERELKTVREAAAKLQAFLKNYPDSKRLDEAQKLSDSLRARLAAHEWYVAGFYAKRGRWAGAAGRWEALVRNYPGSAHEVEALLALADAHLRLEDRFKARQALQQLVVRHPGDPRRAEAERRLAEIR